MRRECVSATVSDPKGSPARTDARYDVVAAEVTCCARPPGLSPQLS